MGSMGTVGLTLDHKFQEAKGFEDSTSYWDPHGQSLVKISKAIKLKAQQTKIQTVDEEKVD